MSARSTDPGERVAAAALACVGVRFRLHGRVPATGLDCVGLAAWALRAGGHADAVPTGYALRGGDPLAVAALLDAGMARSDGARAGDLLLMRTGPGQLHCGIRTPGGLVHADAGARRVVVRPGAVPWAVLGAWRVAPAPTPAAAQAVPLPRAGEGGRKG